MPEFERVVVFGCGTMGSGIAQVAAQAGAQVTVVESNQERLDAGIRSIGDFLTEGVSRGTITDIERDQTLARISGSTNIADAANADLVIEAITENRDVKREFFCAIGELVGADTVMATSTSALPVSDLAAVSGRPTNVAGLHFFNPAPLMQVVEVVAALQTSASVLDRLSNFVTELGKEPVVVKDRPGFLINRLLMPYLNDVIQAYDDGLATAADLDIAIKLGLGYKQGPLELLDRIGLDVHAHATQSAYDALLDPVYAPPPLLQAMVAAGRLGNKNGQGFQNIEETA